MEWFMGKVLESQHPLVKQKLTRLRRKSTDPKIFRELVREITLLLCYEATADLAIDPTTVVTPMGTANGFDLLERVGLVPILRAGLGMVGGA
jgi:uracil phosphoribosyltransferase